MALKSFEDENYTIEIRIIKCTITALGYSDFAFTDEIVQIKIYLLKLTNLAQ